MMSLEDEVKKEISDAVRRGRESLEASMTSEDVQAHWLDMIAFLNNRVEAGEKAILRLAREIDSMRA
jgi:hypothetical protein